MIFTSRKHHTQQRQINPLAILLVALVMVSVSLSLIQTLLPWVVLLAICAFIIRLSLYLKWYKHLPSVRSLNLLAVLSMLGLAYFGFSSGLLFSMLNLLVLACALKLMQVRHLKDVYQLILSVCFLIGCGFIFNQSIGFSLLYLVLLFGLLVSLLSLHAPGLAFSHQLARVRTLSLQALPIGLLLLLVMPQLSPMWRLPAAKGMQTGLADSITPGDIAELTQSSDLAFRATFNFAPPSPSQRYWRAIVMEDFDGKTWKVNSYRPQSKAYLINNKQRLKPKFSDAGLNYELIVEPNNQDWLYTLALSLPSSELTNQAVILNTDYTLSSQRPLISQSVYSLNFYPTALAEQALSAKDRQINLTVPTQSNPQTQNWVKTLKQSSQNEQQIIQAIKDFFTQQAFVYTLRPVLMQQDPIDQFLFEQQAGFCSHYASAMAYALRLADIPARVVTGYLGGELINRPQSSPYISVYQYDAHAWVEAYTAQTGWQRIDPTALVAPDRIEFGLQQAMLAEGSFLADSPFALARLSQFSWLNDIRLFLADLDYNWSRWVLGFNQQKQRQLFQSILGQLTPMRLTLFSFAVLFIICALLLVFFLPHWLKQPVPTSLKLYLKALQLFANTTNPRQNWQGPVEFEQQVQLAFPTEVSQPLASITGQYLKLTYQAQHLDKDAVNRAHKHMRSQIKLLKSALIKLKQKA
ncbi:transglutaminase family protein [Paraglaciecola aestuariivivens]